MSFLENICILYSWYRSKYTTYILTYLGQDESNASWCEELQVSWDSRTQCMECRIAEVDEKKQGKCIDCMPTTNPSQGETFPTSTTMPQVTLTWKQPYMESNIMYLKRLSQIGTTRLQWIMGRVFVWAQFPAHMFLWEKHIEHISEDLIKVSTQMSTQHLRKQIGNELHYYYKMNCKSWEHA